MIILVIDLRAGHTESDKLWDVAFDDLNRVKSHTFMVSSQSYRDNTQSTQCTVIVIKIIYPKFPEILQLFSREIFV